MRPRVLIIAVLAFVGCRNATGPESVNKVGIGFQFARTSTATAIVAAANANRDGTSFVGVAPVVTPTANGLRITRDADVIVISKAQFVIRDVKLKSASTVCADDDDAKNSDKRDHSNDADHDCPTLRVGPFLVNLPVNGADAARVSVPVPAGTYTSVRLTLHKVTSSGATDALFAQANPDFRDISIRLDGTYNGLPFVFVSDVDAQINAPLAQPLVIGPAGHDVTVSIDLSTWFIRSQSGLYAPALANTPGAVRSAVQNNIKNAFRVFGDRDHDGRED